MSTIIAINGKGGTGKTTIAALFLKYLIERGKGSVLAVDADPNSCLAAALGLKPAQTIVDICDELSENMGSLPAGMTKERFIQMRVQESVAEGSDIDLLVMGRPEGPGCYCYVNNLLRGIINELIRSYSYIVMDNAAGMEHISRRTTGTIDNLVLVSDYSVSGLRSSKNIADLAKKLKIKVGRSFLIINRIDGKLDPLKSEIEATNLELIGELPYSKELVEWNVKNNSILDFNDKAIGRSIDSITEKVLR